MMSYRHGAQAVEAVQFDGSAASAREICARIGCSLDGERLAVATGFGTVYAGAGCWIVRDCATRTVSVTGSQAFAERFEAVDATARPAIRLGGH